jgi:putative membrane protein
MAGRGKMCRGRRTAWIIGGTVIAILVILTILGRFAFHSEYRNWGGGMMGPGMMYGYGGGWIMGIIMLLFWGLIVWGIIALIRHFSVRQPNNFQPDSALEILRKRYAQGEINKEEFEEKKKALT